MKCGPILKYNRAMKNCPSLLCLPGVILAAALSAGGAASQGLPWTFLIPLWRSRMNEPLYRTSWLR